MRFHVTIREHVFSILLLAACFVPVIVLFSLNAAFYPGALVADHLVDSLAGKGSSWTLRIDSIESSLFSSLKAEGLELMRNGEDSPIFSAKSISLDVGLGHLLFPSQLPEIVNATLTSPLVVADADLIGMAEHLLTNSDLSRASPTGSSKTGIPIYLRYAGEALRARRLHFKIQDGHFVGSFAALGVSASGIQSEFDFIPMDFSDNPFQGFAKIDFVDLSHDAWGHAFISGSTGTFGTDPSGKAVLEAFALSVSFFGKFSGISDIRLVVHDPVLSLSSELPKDLLLGDGELVVAFDSFGLAAPVIAQQVENLDIQIGASNIHAGLQGWVPFGARLDLNALHVESTIPLLNPLGIDVSVPDISMEIDMGNSDSSRSAIRVSSPNSVDIHVGPDLLGKLHNPVVHAEWGNGYISYRSDFDGFETFWHPIWERLLNFPLPIERFLLNDAHVQYTTDLYDSISYVEGSGSLQLDTGIDLFNRITFGLSADAVLNSAGTLNSLNLGCHDLVLSGIPGTLQFDGTANQEPLMPMTFAGTIAHDAGIAAQVYWNTAEETFRVVTSFESVHPMEFSNLLSLRLPWFDTLIDASTILSGNVSATLNTDFQGGKGSAELGFSHILVNNNRFSVASTVSGSFNNSLVSIDLATVTTEGARLWYSGDIDKNTWLPRGKVGLAKVKTGETLGEVEFAFESPKTSSLVADFPLIPGLAFSATVSLNEDRRLLTVGNLSVLDQSYPISLLIDVGTGKAALDSSGLKAQISLSSAPAELGMNLDLDRFRLPSLSIPNVSGLARISGKLDAVVSLDNGAYSIHSDRISVSGLTWAGGTDWSMSSSLDMDSKALSLDYLVYQDKFGTLAGGITANQWQSLFALQDVSLVDNFSVIAFLESAGGGSEIIECALFSGDDNDFFYPINGSLFVDGLRLQRFIPAIGPAVLDGRIVGGTDMSRKVDGHASLQLRGNDSEKIPGIVSLELDMDERGLVLSSGSWDGLQVSIPRIVGLIPFDGNAWLEIEAAYPFSWDWRDATSSGVVRIETTLPGSTTLATWMQTIGRLVQERPQLSISIMDIRLLGEPWIPDGTWKVSFDGDTIRFTDGYDSNMEGWVDTASGRFEAYATDVFPVAFRAQGRIATDELYIALSDVAIPITLLNPTFRMPVIVFSDGLVRGNIVVDGTIQDPSFHGVLWADTLDAEAFWVPGSRISVKNPVMTLLGQRAYASAVPLVVGDSLGNRSGGTLSMDVFMDGWKIQRYMLDFSIPEDPIHIWVPIKEKQLNIDAMVRGAFRVDGTMKNETLLGDLIVSDGLVDFVLPEVPDWYVGNNRTSVDIAFTTGRNFRFVYPESTSPIVQASLADNQRMRLKLEAPAMTLAVDGELDLQSGEIYYVQKNFYITEGSLVFKKPSSQSSTEFNPLLNLRARLREYDMEGNRIDIYLVLQDSQLDAISPRFESIPMRSTNEILELLGQGIISGTSFASDGFGQVFALATVATDVISRLGYIGGTTSTGFSNLMKTALGVDIVTIRTNLLQNILLDAIPGLGFDSSSSPISRYLHNTTMYLGTYLLDDLYLQGMVHMRQSLSASGGSFLAEDLAVDTELSLEWITPLASFTIFTQPDVLSIFNLFDTIGLSVTKRFVF